MRSHSCVYNKYIILNIIFLLYIYIMPIFSIYNQVMKKQGSLRFIYIIGLGQATTIKNKNHPTFNRVYIYIIYMHTCVYRKHITFVHICTCAVYTYKTFSNTFLNIIIHRYTTKLFGKIFSRFFSARRGFFFVKLILFIYQPGLALYLSVNMADSDWSALYVVRVLYQ